MTGNVPTVRRAASGGPPRGTRCVATRYGTQWGHEKIEGGLDGPLRASPKEWLRRQAGARTAVTPIRAEIDWLWLRRSAEDTVPRGGPPDPARRRRRESRISESGQK